MTTRFDVGCLINPDTGGLKADEAGLVTDQGYSVTETARRSVHSCLPPR